MEGQCLIGCLLAMAVTVIGSERRPHQVQHGSCSYTFLLPEVEECPPVGEFQETNLLQRDSPSAGTETSGQAKKLQNLESVMENNTLWLEKLERYIHENVLSELEEVQRNTVHTQTAAMLEIGTNLLSQSAEQTRKLTDVETQVLNQTSRLEMLLLECSVSTNNLEKQVLLQTLQISRLDNQNSFLEQRLAAMESRHSLDQQLIQEEKKHLQELLERQSLLVTRLEGELDTAARNSTKLQREHATLMDNVQKLLALVTLGNEISTHPEEKAPIFLDCSDVFRSGIKESGVYSLNVTNSTKTVKVFCDMKTRGGGWTVLQHRKDGSVDFHRSWRDYQKGFGDPEGEYWLGNDFIHQLTTTKEYALEVKLRDVEGNQAHSVYDRFFIDGEDKNYSLHARGFGGSAGRISSLTHSGTQFSTKDRDNDRCSCKCAQMASGGWWFEACGPSNLNGIYYAGSSNIVRYNGIKWYYWKGPSMMATMTTMMVRPVDF